MKIEDIIIKSMKKDKKERGVSITKPNIYLSEGHIKKADHNLVVMTDLNKLGHEDWVVISAYYAMYQSAISLLARIGLESKEHSTTAAVLEYLFDEKISRDLIGKFNELKNRIELITIDEKYIDYLWKVKQAREKVQYGISINYKETDIIIKNAREFVIKIKLVLNELDDKFIEILNKKMRELQKLSEKLQKDI